MSNANTWIETLDLLTHPEGGYYREIYRSEYTIGKPALPSGYKGNRSVGTSIYYLLKSGQISLLHRINSDEIWHHYDGSPIVLFLIHENGMCEEKFLGKNIAGGEFPQIVISGGTWFGALPKNDNSFSLAGCTVHPGFDFEDFELADRGKMLSEFPHLESIIKKLTKE